jgi:hypothetical protein
LNGCKTYKICVTLCLLMLFKNLTKSNLGTTMMLIYKDVNRGKDVVKSAILTPQNKKKCSFIL